MNHSNLSFNISETWFGEWNPLRDEYGYPINTSMPAGFYIEHGSSVIKRWIPEQGEWNNFMDLTRMTPGHESPTMDTSTDFAMFLHMTGRQSRQGIR